MIFSNGDVNSIRMIRTVLTKFQDLSGLYPNPNKSDIFLSGVLNAEREQIIHILGFRERCLIFHTGLLGISLSLTWASN